MADADWTLGVPTRHVEADGTATVVATLADGDSPQFTLTVTMSPQRELSVLCEAADGAESLSNFTAWST